MPTRERSLPAIAIRRGGELLLFDCGEGTQRQMVSARIGFRPKTYIFISHMHLDHISGLPGLIHTLSLLSRKDPLYIFGPSRLSEYVQFIAKMAGPRLDLPFPIMVHEITEGLIHRGKDYGVHAASADHDVPCFAYALIEDERPGRFYPDKARRLGVPEGPMWARLKRGFPVTLPSGEVIKPEEVCGPKRAGRRIVYSSDTRPIGSVITLAKDADILIHDATLDDALWERAREDGHSTPSQAAEVAKEARAKRLVLTHISARYKDPSPLLEHARRIFPHVDVAEDFMRISIPYT
ncbi:MAG: Ribonuclease Z [Candidatus Bathyarchaeota archaeon BA1]|nr:MAG: Ribonuclease Z [Candidatus Bathyarchaeota archaeon BA1]